MKTATTLEPPDFSLVLGGPLFQLFHRAYLSGDALELLRRRVVVITLFTWVPLLLLSAIRRRSLRRIHQDTVPVRYRGTRSVSGRSADARDRRARRP